MLTRIRLALYAIVAFASATAAAEELRYQAVMYVWRADSFEVLDSPAHHIGFAQFRGLAILPDGAVAVHRYEGWFDLLDGSGPFHGYALWRFGDGLERRAACDGRAQRDSTGKVTVVARFHGFSGSGRYADVTGEGSFAGRRLEPIDQGGATYLDGSLVLEVAE